MKLQGITSKIALFSNRKKVAFGKEVNDSNNSCISKFESSIQHREITIKMLQDRKNACLIDIAHYQKMLVGSQTLGSISSKVYYESRLANAREQLDNINVLIKNEKETLRIEKLEYKQYKEKMNEKIQNKKNK